MAAEFKVWPCMPDGVRYFNCIGPACPHSSIVSEETPYGVTCGCPFFPVHNPWNNHLTPEQMPTYSAPPRRERTQEPHYAEQRAREKAQRARKRKAPSAKKRTWGAA